MTKGQRVKTVLMSLFCGAKRLGAKLGRNRLDELDPND
jgi:hypothetical protein